MSVTKGLLTISLLLLLAVPATYAQKSKAQLQKEKQENLEKIKAAEKILTQTAGKKKNTLGQLSALNERINAQESLIHSIRKEVGLLNGEINENNMIISSLEEDINKLKKEYAAMVYAAYKANQGYNRLTFIFSAKSFNQFLMRLKYMEQYGEARKKQAEQIGKVQETLSDQVSKIKTKRDEKSKLLNEQEKENEHLGKLKGDQSELVKSLQKQENELKKDLEERKKAVAKLDKLINDIINEEIARAKAAEKKSTSVAEANVKLSGQFTDNRTKLPWPVSGFISQKFGRQPHPILKGIIMDNTGVYIQTKQGEKVKASFNGEVTVVAFLPSVGNTILINHGEYFTVYAGLKHVAVKRGQKVTTGQELGDVMTNKDGVSELKFEVRKNTTPMDPQKWLMNK